MGGSYIALECAGFLTELGCETHVAVRSILLRGFDRQCAEKIGSVMHDFGTDFLYETTPTKIVEGADGRLEVTLYSAKTKKTWVETYDTVVYAIGRTADTRGLNLAAAGLKANAMGKFVTDDEERTNVPHIFAIGDVLEGRPELTPVAIKTGELLARRLFAGSKIKMDYDLVPTTVFTPTEYGCCGLSEEEAIARHGEENVEVTPTHPPTLLLLHPHPPPQSIRFPSPALPTYKPPTHPTHLSPGLPERVYDAGVCGDPPRTPPETYGRGWDERPFSHVPGEARLPQEGAE